MSTDTALVVIDAQIGVVGEAYHRDEGLEIIQLLLGRARSSGTPVLYVQHNEQGGMEPGAPMWKKLSRSITRCSILRDILFRRKNPDDGMRVLDNDNEHMIHYSQDDNFSS